MSLEDLATNYSELALALFVCEQLLTEYSSFLEEGVKKKVPLLGAQCRKKNDLNKTHIII